MHGMLGVIKLLKETELNSEQSDLLSILSECGSGLVNLINDVMDISKIEHDKEITLRPSNFNLSKVCENAINLFKPICTEKKLNLVLNYQSKVENYIGDSSRVGQILNNLLGNAIKFTESGKITLFVYNEQEFDSQQVCFKISDTGIGMDKDFLKQIFTPYSQADDSTSRVHQGTGLGLTITKAILDQMNGEIKVTSELGVGTTFDFNIPLKKSEEIIENVEEINDQFNFLLQENILIQYYWLRITK